MLYGREQSSKGLFNLEDGEGCQGNEKLYAQIFKKLWKLLSPQANLQSLCADGSSTDCIQDLWAGRTQGLWSKFCEISGLFTRSQLPVGFLVEIGYRIAQLSSSHSHSVAMWPYDVSMVCFLFLAPCCGFLQLLNLFREISDAKATSRPNH